MNKKIAIVTGGNKGIGLEICRQLAKKNHHVILTARSSEKGQAAVLRLKSEGLDVEFHSLDVTSLPEIESLSEWIQKTFGRVDVLVNNAGVLLDPSRHPPQTPEASAFTTDLKVIEKSIQTNTFGAFLLCQKLIPLMLKGKYGRVVNVSSGMGQLSDMNGGWPGYRISKVALNAVTRIFADEVAGQNVLVNSVCPGWVKTDMGGPEAELTPAEGADTIVWLATLPDGAPSGGFFRGRKPIEW